MNLKAIFIPEEEVLLLHAGVRGERDFPSAVFKLNKRNRKKKETKHQISG